MAWYFGFFLASLHLAKRKSENVWPMSHDNYEILACRVAKGYKEMRDSLEQVKVSQEVKRD